jgi:hypothetical protein
MSSWLASQPLLTSVPDFKCDATATFQAALLRAASGAAGAVAGSRPTAASRAGKEKV